MSDSIEVTVELSGEHWIITANVVAGSEVLPSDIFVYENTGTIELGRYVGVCSFNEMQRIQIWKTTIIPKFGNRFVRAGQAKIQVSLDTDPNAVVSNLLNTAKMLKTELLATQSTTTVYPI